MGKLFLSGRLTDIVQILIKADDYITSEELAEMLGTSTRTIFREIQGINRTLEKYHCSLETKSGKGIRLTGDRNGVAEKLKGQQDVSGNISYYSKEQRRNLLIADCLKNREIQKLGYYAHKFKVSEATISNDINAVESWLQEHKIRLVRNVGRVIAIECDEKKLRDTILDFLYNNILGADHQRYERITNEKEAGEFFLQISNEDITDILNQEVLLKIFPVLERQKAGLLDNLTSASYIDLMIYIAVAVFRVRKNGCIILEEEQIQKFKTDPLFVKLLELVRELEGEFDICLSEDEAGYIYMYLKGAQLQYTVDRKDSIEKRFEESDYVIMVKDMINVFSTLSNLNLAGDELLMESLLAHVVPSLNRVYYCIKVRNPLIEEIKSQYDKTFQYCEKCCNIILAKHNLFFNDDEIGFLTLHFQAAIERQKAKISKSVMLNVGCVCLSGIGLSGLLAARISNVFSDFVKVYTLSLDQVNGGELSGIDVLISTTKIAEQTIPVMFVSPLLQKEEVEKMKALFERLREEKISNTDSSVELSREININSIINNIKVVTIDGSLHKEPAIMELLKSKGIKGETADIYKNAVMERESLGQIVLKEKAFILFHCAINLETEPIIIFFNLDFRRGVSRDFEGYTTGALMIIGKKCHKIEKNTMAAITASFIYEPKVIETICQNDENEMIHVIRNHLRTFEEKRSL